MTFTDGFNENADSKARWMTNFQRQRGMQACRKRNFSVRLRELRKERGLTQEALAESADLSGNYISDLELGLTVPSLTILVWLSQALGVATPTCFAISRVKRSGR